MAAPKTPPRAPPAISPEAMMTPRSRICAVWPPAFVGALVQEVREEAADQRGRVQFQRQVHAEREDQRRDAEHLHDQRDHRADAEQEIGHGLVAHEALHQRLHDGGLGRGQHRARVAGAASPN